MSPQSIHPSKWRETCDPFALRYTAFQLEEILGYPHAGNDVFHVRGICGGRRRTAYLKAKRHHDSALEHEVHILKQLDAPVYPKVLDYDLENGSFSVTEELPGLRLSVIVGENHDLVSLSYMEAYGKTFAGLHQLKVLSKGQEHRKFHDVPGKELLEKLDLSYLTAYFAQKPKQGETVFCHGDFHYANLLWQDHHISAVLDFELAGYGDRDFDIAWAVLLRPGQKFLKTDEELEAFLRGYQKRGTCDKAAVKYYMAQCYVHFLAFSDDEPEYGGYVRSWLEKNCR